MNELIDQVLTKFGDLTKEKVVVKSRKQFDSKSEQFAKARIEVNNWIKKEKKRAAN